MPSRQTRRHLAAPAALLLLVFPWACGGEGDEAPADEPTPAQESGPVFSMRVDDVGFSTPESVLHDAEADVYLVANINGGPTDEDDNGFISRVSPGGELLELRWIDGTSPDVTLNGPKGMALVADTLFVMDIDCLRRFHRVTGEELIPVCLDDAVFLNDVTATSRGDLYFTDSGTAEVPGAVYLLRRTADVPQKVTLADGTVLADGEVEGPNGVYVDERGLFVATFGSGEVFRVTPEGERVQLLPPSDMQLDGFVSLEEWGFLFSSWGHSAVYWVTPDGNILALADGIEAPADLGYDARRNRALIPLFLDDALLIREVR